MSGQLPFRHIQADDCLPAGVAALIAERDDWPADVIAIQFGPEGVGAERRATPLSPGQGDGTCSRSGLTSS